MSQKVIAREEMITMPTYKTSEPDKNPLFFEKRVYQGSSGKVYPHPVTEKIFDDKEDVDYPGIILENDYLKVVILPTLGGRIQRALDKTNNYDFVYYNHVIKPALVGLIGPWISGGIEFNWPQHHRPTTYMPTEYSIVENEDGSKTVWVSEIDKMYGTKGMAGFTLYPDKAYIEITGKVHNRTDTPQTFLWWANPAVPANDYTLSVFPPDVHAVMDHGKRAVSDFPIATGTYYKYDYSEGVDISKYKNIKVPTSYMAYHSDYNFIGNYDEKLEAGLLHVADHNVSPGKKQWVWGNSDFGLAWDRNLTDDDGPYVELMTGVFTDNQPDFTWLRPYESKEFKQYFMPYKGVGRVKNATINAAVNVEIDESTLVYTVYGTQKFEDVTINIIKDGELIHQDTCALSPEKHYQNQVKINFSTFDQSCKIVVLNHEQNELVSYQGYGELEQPLPDPAESLDHPSEIKSTEDLYLAATHIEQYRHATLNAEDYYLEGLKRDDTDLRLNNGYGMHLYKKGLFSEALIHFEKSVAKQKWKSPNPYYGEPLFNLALTQLQLGIKDSYENFYKATWNEDTQSASFYQLAVAKMNTNELDEALDFVEKSLVKNSHNMKARLLKSILLEVEKTEWLNETLSIDPLDLGSHFELWKENKDNKWQMVMRGSLNNYLELSLDYYHFGLLNESLMILENCSVSSPLVHYYKALYLSELGKMDEAKNEIKLGEAAKPDYCFPNKLLEIKILETVIRLSPDSSSYAKYYLGNLFYDKKRKEEAIKLWESAAEKLTEFATVYRNLSFAYYNEEDDEEKAYEMICLASDIDQTDARILLERDLLASKMGKSVEERIAVLEERESVTAYRDDLFIVYITLLNNLKQYEKALELINSRQFHPWEGGEGKVSTQYMYSLIESTKKEVHSFDERVSRLEATKVFPHNLGEGKLPNAKDNIADYYIGKLYQEAGNQVEADKYFELATQGDQIPESVLYYYDQPADTILYRGLAFEELGNQKEANSSFYQLISYGKKHYFDEVEYDYFAVSMPATVVFKNNIQLENQLYCKYLIALGKIGLKEYDEAREILVEILNSQPDHQGAIRHLEMV